MSKYIIDVGDAYTEHICGKGDMLCLPVRINEFDDNWLNTNIPLTPYTEPDTEKVREEALEAIREEVLDAVNRIYDIPQDDRGGIFPKATYYVSDIVRKYSASEIIEKIRQYEQEQEQIQVGDEVISPDGKGVVTEISDRTARIMFSSGLGYMVKSEDLTKTGRHFPEIAAVLEKMRGEKDG